MSRILDNKQSRKRLQKSRKRLGFWQLTKLFSFKGDGSRKSDWSTLRGNLVSRALDRNVKFLSMNNCPKARELVSKWIYQFEFTSYNKGSLYSCKYFKSIYSYCQRYVVSHKSEPLPFTRINKFGVPVVVSFLTPLLRGSLEDRRNALHILSMYKLIIVNNKEVSYSSIETVSSIKDTGLDNVPGEFFKEASKVFKEDKEFILKFRECFLEVLEENFPKNKVQNRLSELESLSTIYVSGKKGPNGPSLTHSCLDYLALKTKEPHLLNSIEEICRMTRNMRLREILDAFEESDGLEIETEGSKILSTSRLSLKQEAGGKNRIFAIGDWFTQSSLAGMHQWLFKKLAEFPEDGTFDHNKTALVSKEWTKVKNLNSQFEPHSTDLTSATDRVPSILQREIVNQIFGKEFSNHWFTLMTKRNFTKIGTDATTVYSTGQPMGLLSSWAMLAIWHHMILQSICKYLKVNRINRSLNLPNYLIIGDDVSKLGCNLYNYYIRVVNIICQVPISELKGFTPKTYDKELNPIKVGDLDDLNQGNFLVVEIAKRVFINGFEVSPISPVAIQAGLELPSNFPSLLEEISRRGYKRFMSGNPAVTLSELCFNKVSAVSLASFPLSCAPQFVEVTAVDGDDPIWAKSPWLKSDWDDDKSKDLLKAITKALRDRLNTGIRDVYQTLFDYIDYDCVDTEVDMKGGYRIRSKGLNILLNKVYQKCQDLVTAWATDFTKEGVKEFWMGESPNNLEFKRYLGKMHVIFDITIALQGTSQVLDEKRFSSKFLMQIIKDYLSRA